MLGSCNLADPRFAGAYFDWMMGAAPGAAPNDLIDYFWTDWGGCGSPSSEARSEGSEGEPKGGSKGGFRFNVATGNAVGSLWWANYL